MFSLTGALSQSVTETLSVALQNTYPRDQTNVKVFDWNRRIYSFPPTGQC